MIHNKRISLIFAGLAVTALAGCGYLHPGAMASASAKAHARATSSQAQQAKQAGRVIASTCIPVKDMNRAYFINLVFHRTQAKALEAKCRIPKGNLKPFAKAVAQSLATADPKTPAEKKAWETQTLPKIVEQYQKS